MTRRKIDYWVIPPEADGEFVAGMETVLDTYAEPYDPKFPKLCMDEQPIQLLKETRVPVPATKDHPRRVDYEYERAGTASIFMFCEPLSDWRQVTVRQQRTKIAWAMEVEQLLRPGYASAEKVILVCDNLNTHTIGAHCAAGLVDVSAITEGTIRHTLAQLREIAIQLVRLDVPQRQRFQAGCICHIAAKFEREQLAHHSSMLAFSSRLADLTHSQAQAWLNRIHQTGFASP